jgi:heme exporter protein B
VSSAPRGEDVTTAKAEKVVADKKEMARGRTRTTGWGLFWQQALGVWAKEMKTEWRARYAIGSSILFALVTMIVLSMSVGPALARSELAAALLWIVLLFSATAGLGHNFAREVEGGTWDLLRQSVNPGPLLLGKWLGALSLLAGIVILVLVVGNLLMSPVVENGLGFLVVMLLGSLCLGVTLPLVSALLSHARRHGGLVVALTFPLVLPGLLASVAGTRRAFEGAWPGGEIRLLIAFTGVIMIAGWRLFDFVWED